MKALVIPVEGPLEEIELPEDDSLSVLQAAVGGWIEPIGLPDFIRDSYHATSYVNEEGKIFQLPVNMRATDFLVPGIGIEWGDVIRGPLVLCGFDPDTGEHRGLPAGVVRRARLIESEAS